MTDIQTVTAGGLDLGYLSDGPTDGPLALCLHGFPDSAHTWRHLLPALAEQGYHAVAPFSRAYAPTAVPADGAYGIDALAADVNALHDALGGDADAVLIGHDWGATVAYPAVVRAPERWRRVVTMSVPPLPAIPRVFVDFAQLKRSFYVFLFQTPLAEAALDEQFIAGMWRDWSVRADSSEDVAHVLDCLNSPQRRSAAIGYYRALLDPSPQRTAFAAEQDTDVTEIERPVLYLHGALDNALGLDIVADPLPYLPAGSAYEIVSDAGHFLQLDQPETVNTLVLDWLAKN